MSGWRPIAEAQFVRDWTVADLRMPSGRVYRATWKKVGRCTAWWPESAVRKAPIGLYDPVAFRVVAAGTGTDA